MAFTVVNNPTLGQSQADSAASASASASAQPTLDQNQNQNQVEPANIRPPTAPIREDGTRYRYELIIEGGKRRVYADTTTELCQVLIPGYPPLSPPPQPQSQPSQPTASANTDSGTGTPTGGTGTGTAEEELEGERYFHRLRYAVGVQVQVQSFILSEVEPGDDVTDEEWAVLAAPRDVPPQATVWECPVPLVLVETYYEPDGELPRPKGQPRTGTSQNQKGAADGTGAGADNTPGAGGDGNLDANIIWINPIAELELLESLHQCGYVSLAMANSVLSSPAAAAPKS
jgi:hypothetical protein